MCNQGEKVIGVTGRDKRVCVSCVASYSLCVPPLPLDSGGGGAVPSCLALAVFCQNGVGTVCPYLSVKGRWFSVSEGKRHFLS